MALGSLFIAAAQDAAIPATAPQAAQSAQAVTTGPMGQAVQSVGQAAQTAGAAAQAPATPSSHTGSIMDAVQQSSGNWGGYFEALAILFLLLALLWLVVWFLRRRGGFSGNGPAMYIESRLNMGQKKWLVVTRVHGRRLVLGVTDHNISLVTELPEELPLQKKEENFASMFKKNVAKEDDSGDS